MENNIYSCLNSYIDAIRMIDLQCYFMISKWFNHCLRGRVFWVWNTRFYYILCINSAVGATKTHSKLKSFLWKDCEALPLLMLHLTSADLVVLFFQLPKLRNRDYTAFFSSLYSSPVVITRNVPQLCQWRYWKIAF